MFKIKICICIYNSADNIIEAEYTNIFTLQRYPTNLQQRRLELKTFELKSFLAIGVWSWYKNYKAEQKFFFVVHWRIVCVTMFDMNGLVYEWKITMENGTQISKCCLCLKKVRCIIVIFEIELWFYKNKVLFIIIWTLFFKSNSHGNTLFWVEFWI